MTENLPTVDLVQTTGREALRPARPMTPAEFEKRCLWFGATIDYMARWDAAVAYAAEYDLILEKVPPTKKRKK